ncbi:MAG: 4a-hydroxytetrahydrobiopterin dehydratase [Solirubrobacteraceae bacterium]
MAETLEPAAVDDAIAGTDWTRDGDAIARDLDFDDFAAAMAHVNAVAEAAEEANHHPDILVHGWNKVRLTLSTHSAGGVTQADVDMTRTLDAL